MSTDKCPKCGKPLIWCENCFPVFAYCSDTEYCCYETQTKHMEPELVLPSALHRIRELEERIEPLELTVKVLESDKQTRNDALDHERKRIAELEGQYKRAYHVVEVNRQAKWKAENRVADLEEKLRARPYPEEKPTEAGDYLCQFVAKSETWLQVSEWALPNLYREEACFLGEAKDKKITNWWPLPEVKK